MKADDKNTGCESDEADKSAQRSDRVLAEWFIYLLRVNIVILLCL